MTTAVPYVSSATADGVTDDTATIQGELNYLNSVGGGTLDLPIGTCKVTTLNLYSGISLRGQSRGACTLKGTSGHDLLVPDSSYSGSYLEDVMLEKICLDSGTNCFNLGQVGAVGLVVRDVKILSADNAGFLAGNWLERNVFDNVEFGGSDYGFQITNNGNASGNYLDKTVFRGCRFTGQSINGFFKDTARTSSTVTLDNCRFDNIGQHPFYMNGPAHDWLFLNLYFEANGTSGPALADTTGSITSGSHTLTVASATNFANGQAITVQGAGVGGVDLYTTISSHAGTTLTLATAASTTVTSKDVTNALYDCMSFASSGLKVRMNIFGGSIGDGTGTNDKIRYAIDTRGATCLGQGGFNMHDIYDPDLSNTFINWDGPIRHA